MGGKCYFITGGGGLLGSYIVRLLCQLDDQEVTKLIVFDINFDTQTRHDIEMWCRAAEIDCRIVIGDINDGDKLLPLLRDCDVIVHCAAVVDFNGYTCPRLMHRVNVDGTRTVLDAGVAMAVGTFVYTSSIAALFPNRNGDRFEGDERTAYPGAPALPYGESKRAAERLVLARNGARLPGGGNRTLRTVALRLPMIYGENASTLRRQIAAFSARKLIISFQAQPVDQLYVGNAAWAHIVAARQLQHDNNTG